MDVKQGGTVDEYYPFTIPKKIIVITFPIEETAFGFSGANSPLTSHYWPVFSFRSIAVYTCFVQFSTLNPNETAAIRICIWNK